MKRRAAVLLVDDNPADLDLIREAFDREQGISVSAVPDGVEAIGFLRRQRQYADAPIPDLVMLDLNLPKKDGRAVLTEIKSDPQLRRVPIVVFSTSEAQFDVGRSYELGANSYVRKPGNLPDFSATVRSIRDFWLGCACPPPRRNGE